ncbi:hypothetical protein V6N11_047454 [Hibiscus sabdariffa]|uniref:DUF4283 domain-containing protein n=1 Tax=Hibiscus sabdariffa TaxID=183260 RepID=A0ABR2A8T6_9ROSI
MWKPKLEIKLMDIENEYFLTSFYSQEDFLTVLVDGPWMVLGLDFQLLFYKRSLIEEIGNCIGHVIHIDYQTENGCRGRFARMTICIDLNKPSVSKLLVNGKIQVVEYESLQTICFKCGRYEHVDKRKRRPVRKLQAKEQKHTDMEFVGSCFNPIYEDDEDVQVTEGVLGNLNDFPIVTRSASKGSSSNTVPSILKTTRLDKSRHLVVVLPENSDPNPCLAMDTLGNPSMSDNTLILGNPPDTRKNLPPNPVAFVSRQDHAKSGTNMVEPVETYEVDMLD